MKRILFPVLLLLGGCVTLPPDVPQPEGVEDFAAHRQRVEALEAWRLRGRAAVTTPDDSGNLTVAWRQQGAEYLVELRAPLGAGAVRLQGVPGEVRLRTSDGEEASASEPAELLRRYTGYQLPVEALRYWLLGVGVPDVPAAREFGADGLLQKLQQQGWTVDYRRYGVFGDLALPTKIFMRNGDGIELRLIVSEWQLSAEAD